MRPLRAALLRSQSSRSLLCFGIDYSARRHMPGGLCRRGGCFASLAEYLIFGLAKYRLLREEVKALRALTDVAVSCHHSHRPRALTDVAVSSPQARLPLCNSPLVNTLLTTFTLSYYYNYRSDRLILHALLKTRA